MQLKDNWFGLEGVENGRPYLIRGREEIISFREKGNHQVRIDICYNYIAEGETGMPDISQLDLMEEIENALVSELESDIFAILAFVYTGNSQRVWYWYCEDDNNTMLRINNALSIFGSKLPLEIYSCIDPDWEIYSEILD